MKVIILIKKPNSNSIYILGKKWEEVLQFENIESAINEWQSKLFGQLSSAKQELYEKLFIAFFDPHIVTEDIDLCKSHIYGDERLQTDFYQLEGRKVDQKFAHELWLKSEALTI